MSRPGGRGRVALALAVLATSGAGVVLAAPSVGRYDGELCVAVKAGAPSCGRAQLEWLDGGVVTARVDDIVYHLQLRAGGEVAVLLTQGAGQLDAFVADGAWSGKRLRFADLDRGARYEIRFGSRRGR